MLACLSVDALDHDLVAQRVADGSCMQFFSDGGFREGAGAAAFVVVKVNSTAAVERALAGRKGVLIAQSFSAFQTELLAADMAAEFAERVQNCW